MDSIPTAVVLLTVVLGVGYLAVRWYRLLSEPRGGNSAGRDFQSDGGWWIGGEAGTHGDAGAGCPTGGWDGGGGGCDGGGAG